MRVAAIATVAGALLGAGTFALHFLPEDIAMLTRFGVPWVGAAFALGALLREPWPAAAAAGAWLLVVAVALYYAGLWAWGGYASSGIGVWWALAAVPGGALFAGLGAAWRGGDPTARVVAAGVLGGALVGEAILFAVLRPGPLVVALALAGLVAPLLLVSDRLDRGRAYAVAAAFTVIAAPAVGVTHTALQLARSAAHALAGGGFDY